MLKSCGYCGGIHERNFDCPSKPTRNKNITHVDRFRWTAAWQDKRRYIREDRDKHMCQICIRKLYNSQTKYNFDNIQVHHIIPVNEGSEGWARRLDDEWLISLCSYHHVMAEDGEIPREELLEIVREQEEKLL